MAVVTVDEVNDSSGHVVEVENRGVRVQAGGVELIAVFHGQFSKGSKVLPLDDPDHFIHPLRHHTVCPILKVDIAMAQHRMAPPNTASS